MGTPLIQQRRGKGSIRYRAPSHNWVAEAKHRIGEGVVMDLVHCPGHDAPLARIKYKDGKVGHVIACEGLSVGTNINCSESAETKLGNTMILGNVPIGQLVYNIESNVGDGGKFIRASGGFGRVLAKVGGKVKVMMPSKKEKIFNSKCMATIGTVAGAGRKEKPFMKAGKKFYAAKARGLLYPRVSGVAMNAFDHPFGSGRGRHAGKSKISPRFAPPGRKVGKFHSKRTGKKK